MCIKKTHPWNLAWCMVPTCPPVSNAQRSTLHQDTGETAGIMVEIKAKHSFRTKRSICGEGWYTPPENYLTAKTTWEKKTKWTGKSSETETFILGFHVGFGERNWEKKTWTLWSYTPHVPQNNSSSQKDIQTRSSHTCCHGFSCFLSGCPFLSRKKTPSFLGDVYTVFRGILGCLGV